jgi:hypothetical protein
MLLCSSSSCSRKYNPETNCVKHVQLDSRPERYCMFACRYAFCSKTNHTLILLTDSVLAFNMNRIIAESQRMVDIPNKPLE